MKPPVLISFTNEEGQVDYICGWPFEIKYDRFLRVALTRSASSWDSIPLGSLRTIMQLKGGRVVSLESLKVPGYED